MFSKRRANLKRDILFALIFKAIALFVLWKIFFSHPIDKTLTPQKVSVHMLGKT